MTEMTSGAGRPVILTPDQRLRVFVSSTLQELYEERVAAREAITSLHLAPVMFELGARPHPPRDLYRAYLDQSHLFIGIYWERYGWVAPEMDISGLEDEYRLSGNRPKLIYIKDPAPNREPRLADLLDQIREDDHASYKPFRSAAELRSLIENDLALLLTERFEMTQARVAHTPETTPQPPRPSNLPLPPTPIVGRAAEIAAVRDLLLRGPVRLVTILGPGGMGKSRLALEVAANVRDEFSDGVFFVSLAPIRDPALVPSAIAQVLGLREAGERPLLDLLKDYLRDKHLLLLLDNFEQVVDAGPLVADLLASAPGLELLVTSRAALRLHGEYEFPLAPLDLPDLRHLPALEPLSRTAAVALFVRRAQAVKPGFALTAENAPIIAEICVRLDGLPLAIEMAAARVRFLPPKNILSRLQHRLELLTSSARDLPARQQTMRDTVAWSYDLLDEAEKRLFRRIAVFRSGASLEAIEAICNAAGDLQLDVLDGISTLMDSSLLQHAPAGGADGDTRFLMLQTIREYALEKLEESGESTPLHQSYALFFLKMVEEAEPKIASGERVRWLKHLEAEYDNLRGALEWSLTGTDAPEIALHLSRLLFWYWYFRGRFEEGRNWLARALDHDRQAAPTMARAVALYCAGTLAWFTGEAQEAHDYLQASAAISRQLGEKWVLAMCLGILGVDAVRRYGYDRAQALHAESIALLSEIGAKWSLGWAYFWQGLSAGRANDPAGRAALEQSVAIWRETRDPWALAVAEMGLAEAAYQAGDYEAARASLDDVLPTFREMGDKWLMAHSLMMLGGVALSHGNHEQAEALYAESLTLRRDLGDKYGIAHSLRGLASVAQQQGHAEQAISHYRASLALYREVSSLEGVAACLKGLAVVATVQGQHTHAAEMFSAAENVKAPAGVLIPPTERPTYDGALATLRDQMSADAYAEAWAAGQAMTLEQAITHALEAQEQTHS